MAPTMTGSTNQADALKLLQGLEQGTLHVVDARMLAASLDPVLVHVVLRYLREVYPASNPAARAVLDRVVALTTGAPELVGRIKEGERDPVSEWFSSEYTFADFRGRGSELLDLIVDKLES